MWLLLLSPLGADRRVREDDEEPPVPSVRPEEAGKLGSALAVLLRVPVRNTDPARLPLLVSPFLPVEVLLEPPFPPKVGIDCIGYRKKPRVY